MATLFRIALLSACLAEIGCIAITDATFRPAADLPTLTIHKHWYGLTIGPCGFGTANDATWQIQLRGPGPRFRASELSIGHTLSGTYRPFEKVSGFVELNMKRRTADVQLTIGDAPFEGNGVHRYKEQLSAAGL